jgi:hypothetical protein
LLFASIVPAIALVASCMGATEIVVHISTNACPSLQYTDIWVDGQHVTQAATPVCDPTNALAVVDVGTITVLPSHGIDSDVDIALVGNVGGACANPDTTEQQCIVARRTTAFNPHQRIDLPILLDGVCAGIQCSADQTCVVDVTGPHCSDSTCGHADTPACTVDAGGADAIVQDVIVVDATAPACPTILPSSLGTPTFSWSFDIATTGTLHEDNDAFTTPLTGTFVSAPPRFCDNTYLQSTNGQILASTGSNAKFQQFVTKTFAVGFAYDTTLSDVDLVSLSGSSSGAAGFDIGLVGGQLQVSFSGTHVYSNPSTIVKNGWRRFGMVLVPDTDGNTTLTPYLDGVGGTPVVTPPYIAGAPIVFSVGPVDVDNVTFYSN